MKMNVDTSDVMEHTKKQSGQIKYYIAVAILFLVQLGLITYCFQFKKEGCHSDEMWTYGYANSYEQKDIFQDAAGKPVNFGKWIDGQVLKDYLVVNEGEEFAYDAVCRNHIYDLSPPLHSIILHTISSLFPETFSLWYAFSINMVAFVITMIFLLKSCLIMMDRRRAFLVCMVYGFTRAAIDNSLYLRMYALGTACLMVVMYYMIKTVYMKKEEKYGKHAVTLGIVSFLMFLLHYYMISIAGIMTALFCFYLLCKKEIKRMFQLGFTMLVAFLLSVAVFPSMLFNSQTQVTSLASQNVKMMNYSFEIRQRILWSFLTSKTFTFYISVFPSKWGWIVFGCMIYAMIIAIPLLFLLRENKYVAKLLTNIKKVLKNRREVVPNFIRQVGAKINWIYILLFIACILQVIVVGETSNVYGMGAYIDRYIMNLSPILVMLGLGVGTAFFIKIIKNKKLAYAVSFCICGALIGMNLYTEMKESDYFFAEKRIGQDMQEVVADKNVVIVETNHWLLTALCPKLMNCKRFFMTNAAICQMSKREFEEKMNEGELYIIVDLRNYKSSVDTFDNILDEDKEQKTKVNDELYDNMIAFFEDLDTSTKMKKVSNQYIMSYEMEVYCVNPKE